MKPAKQNTILVFSVIFCLIVLTFDWHKSNLKSKGYEAEYRESIYETYHPEKEDPWVDYFLDSTYKVVVDTTIDVFKVKTGKKINSFSKGFGTIRSMAMHPSGKFLVVLDEYSLNAYNIYNKEEDLWTDEIYSDYDCVEFCDDGKYLILIEYSETEVVVLRWPDLYFLDSYIMGYRTSFNLKYEKGKIVLLFESYKGSNANYRTVFPADLHADTLRFSVPVLIDSLPGK